MYENKNYKLKRQYKLGFADENNYILSFNGTKCVFLNPLSALVLNYLIKKNTSVAERELCKLLNISEEDVKNRINDIILRLSDYLDVDLKPREDIEIPVDNSVEILKQKRNYICPIEKEAKPRKLKFYLTDHCPRQCIYCFAGAKYLNGKTVNTDFLSVERFKQIICEAAEIDVKEIEISGGDPFVLSNVHEYIEVMVKYFPKVWSVSTKALVTYDEAKKLKDIGLEEIQVSIDTFNEQTADRLMGCKGAFAQVMETINNILKSGITLSTNTVVTSLNIYDVPDLFKRLMDMGAKFIRFSYYYISGNRHSDYLFPTNEQFSWLNEQMPPLIEIAKSNNIFTDYYPHEPVTRENNYNARVFCGGFNDAMGIRYDGGVMFCDSLNHCDDFIAGNLKDNSIMEVWNSQAVSNINDPYYFYEKYKGTKCYTCNMFYNCFYKRCYVRSFNQYGSCFDVDPACPLGEKDYLVR